MDFEDTEEEKSANYTFQRERKEKHIYPFIYNLIHTGFQMVFISLYFHEIISQSIEYISSVELT